MRNKTVHLCLLAVVSLMIAACAATEDGVVTYVEKNNSGMTTYVDNSARKSITYVDSAATGISAGRTHSDPFARVKAAVMTPQQRAFVAARTPAEYDNFVRKNKPSELAFVAVQRLARPYIARKDWQGAVKVYERYRDDFPDMGGRFARIISYLETPGEHLEVSGLGSGINTAADEISPVVAADGKTIYFSRECGECGGGEDIYLAGAFAGGWGTAGKFGPPLNTNADEMPLSVAADSSRIAVFGNYKDSYGRGDIYYVEKGVDGWSGRKHYPEPVNTENFESGAMYTADGKAMLFISDRPGGVGEHVRKGDFHHGNFAGNTDIYVYIPHENGESEVVNLGPVINTPYAEYSPYLHPDGKTLYFSSDGHDGLGGLDVFKSTRLSDTSWTLWSEPVNLGKDVNGPYNDWGYQVATSGDKAYFASNRHVGSVGGSDIFSIGLPKKAQPSGVITISGVVRDPDGNPLAADIRWNDLTKNREVGHATSDPNTGAYFLTLPTGGQYGYYADKDGYMGESESFDLRKDYKFKEYILDIVLYPIKQLTSPTAINTGSDETISVPQMVVDKAVERPIRLNNIFFAFGKWELRPESFMELDRWTRLMLDNPGLTLDVYGHTDSIGSQGYNKKLSEKRAAAVSTYLVKHGIAADRIKSFGLGETRPVASNDTEEGRQRNRRVEVKINVEMTPSAVEPGAATPAAGPETAEPVVEPGAATPAAGPETAEPVVEPGAATPAAGPETAEPVVEPGAATPAAFGEASSGPVTPELVPYQPGSPEAASPAPENSASTPVPVAAEPETIPDWPETTENEVIAPSPGE